MAWFEMLMGYRMGLVEGMFLIQIDMLQSLHGIDDDIWFQRMQEHFS